MVLNAVLFQCRVSCGEVNTIVNCHARFQISKTRILEYLFAALERNIMLGGNAKTRTKLFTPSFDHMAECGRHIIFFLNERNDKVLLQLQHNFSKTTLAHARYKQDTGRG